MKDMIDFISTLQETWGVRQIQDSINLGTAWHFHNDAEDAIDGLKEGMYYLPLLSSNDAHSNYVPGRDELEPGTIGTLEYCLEFWNEVAVHD